MDRAPPAGVSRSQAPRRWRRAWWRFCRIATGGKAELTPARPRRSPQSRAARRGGRPGPATATVIDLFAHVAARPVAISHQIAAERLTEDLPFAKTVIRDSTLYHADCRD